VSAEHGVTELKKRRIDAGRYVETRCVGGMRRRMGRSRRRRRRVNAASRWAV
jgi:hypothetical protein